MIPSKDPNNCKSVIRIEDITKKFVSSEQTLVVLEDVNMLFLQGSSYAITGASGIGKSTLLHILAGLAQPTSGAVFFNNRNIALFDAVDRQQFLQKNIGLLFQTPYLIKELTVLENVILKGLIGGESRSACKQRGMHLLDQAGIADKAFQSPALLSGGQKQRVGLMRALFGKPAFLIADEPTGNLDSHTGEAMLELILQCQREYGMGIIVSTHDVYVARRMKEVFMLCEGKLTSLKRTPLSRPKYSKK